MVVAFLWDFAVFCCLDGTGLWLIVLLCWYGDSGFTKLADGVCCTTLVNLVSCGLGIVVRWCWVDCVVLGLADYVVVISGYCVCAVGVLVCLLL